MSFLSSLLPMIAGAASTYFTGNPYLGMALVGGSEYSKTGSLEKGLLAGLGAYGGGQLASGLGALGSSEAGLTSGAEAVTGLQGQAAREALLANPDQYFLKQAPDAFGNLPGAAGFEADTAGMIADPAKQSAFTSAYEKAAVPSAANMSRGLDVAMADPSKYVGAMGGGSGLAKAGLMAAAPALLKTPEFAPVTSQSSTQIAPRYRYNSGVAKPLPAPSARGVEQNYFPSRGYAQISADEAKQLYGFADGGMTYGDGDTQGDPNLMQVKTFDPVIRMADGGIPMPKPKVVTRDTEPMKKPKGLSDMAGLNETAGLYARGGLSDLGDYSDGGRLLRGPGDGVSDSIPAVIANKKPARLADGEFVVPARIVSELGNGSTEAGARKLYAMMDRVQKARAKTVGKKQVAKNTDAHKLMPA